MDYFCRNSLLNEKMMELGIAILAAAAAVLAAVCFRIYRKQTVLAIELEKTKSELMQAASEKEKSERQAAELSELSEKLKSQLSEARIENARLLEKLDNTESFSAAMQKEAEAKFRMMAIDIFDRQTKEFRETSEVRLDNLLKPLKENIVEFKKTISENYVNEAKERSVLSMHLQNLLKLNETIGKEARELTEALTGNTKVQGDWGEMVLESILQKSGLTEGENYYVQPTRQEDGSQIVGDGNRRLRPDVVVLLPDRKFVVIDSKVSLSAYVDYVNSDSEEEREKFGKAHVLSVRNHLKELESKKYQDYVGTSENGRMDYVLMFIPNEHAYMTAMSLDKTLWMEAFEKRVVVISPAHVISTLRLIAQLWTRDKQTKNALRIAEEGGKLYDKFVGFVSDMQDIGTGMKKAQDAYDKAFNKLHSGTGNLITRVRKLKDLGAKAEKTLPESPD